MSEPEFLISVLDRHQDWATIVCLIGGGQEINTGEAGLPEWFSAISTKYSHWDVYASGSLSEKEYTNGEDIYGSLGSNQLTVKEELHLAVSLRSFRSELLSEFIGSVLNLDKPKATELFSTVQKTYPIVLTKNLQQAKEWLRTQARGGEQYGITAYSGALRLKPEGIHIKSKIDPKNWFLNESSDVRSSMFLEDVATEFDIQGLELDWTCVVWDPSLRIAHEEWEFKTFRGTKWQNINDAVRRRYLLNAYRVLLTRARQGMVICIPHGDQQDQTRLPEFYTPIYELFSACGVPSIDVE
ncbi:DNA/RNA helicase domain-containing protein [Halodesulfovibrio sp. MK-HDV]|uniref:DNA/RNA helicase domain-containing protein n=1 Tax=Halodesulfovibrio sp. MK-HDV TaxID=2599925 RepID=UPI001C208CF4|nr:DNA/RNA helicase domain-containing protein [Halodesulfovibrio sp. MK-HDV]